MIDYRLIILAVIGLFIQIAFIIADHHRKYLLATILKSLAALVFVTIAFCGYQVAANKTYAALIVIGILFGFVGDVLHAIRFFFTNKKMFVFIIGTLFFLFGHIIYMIALISVSQRPILNIVIGVILSAVAMLIFKKFTNAKIEEYIVGSFYVLTITVMVAIALGNAITMPDTYTIIFAFGAVFFLISDTLNILYTFGNKKTYPVRIGNLVCYYIGQCLIAFSLFFI